ncbi:hypothetical protein EVAR_90703_1 [Eumeta japonica]|uniref:Uncharacterized protein n=1 Tax=Eumeta variegata TaxID=151549 RepID=A0A4C1SCR6_EUMVA|nr:hypothetical protein EVAR_90703_1 [Eumeta japonica]
MQYSLDLACRAVPRSLSFHLGGFLYVPPSWPVSTGGASRSILCEVPSAWPRPLRTAYLVVYWPGLAGAEASSAFGPPSSVQGHLPDAPGLLPGHSDGRCGDVIGHYNRVIHRVGSPGAPCIHCLDSDIEGGFTSLAGAGELKFEFPAYTDFGDVGAVVAALTVAEGREVAGDPRTTCSEKLSDFRGLIRRHPGPTKATWPGATDA